MCLGVWSRLGYVKDSDLLAASTLPDVVGEEEELELGWDTIN